MTMNNLSKHRMDARPYLVDEVRVLWGQRYSAKKIERLSNAIGRIEDYSTAEQKEFSKIIEKIRKIPKFATMEKYTFKNLILSYFQTEWAYNAEDFIIAMILNYKKGTEIRLSRLMQEMGVPMALYDDYANMFRGLNAVNPEYLTASFTHDLEKLHLKG